jgi:hypothetical protein
MEVKKFKNPSTIWLSARTCFKILRFSNLVNRKNPLYVLKSYFGHIPKIEQMQKFTTKNTLPLPM